MSFHPVRRFLLEQKTKQDILKNVVNQTTLAPIDFNGMDTKPLILFEKCFTEERAFNNIRVNKDDRISIFG